MAQALHKLVQPDFYDPDTFEEIERLGVAAAQAIVEADNAAGNEAVKLHKQADEAMDQLCELVRRELANHPGSV